MRKTNLQRPNFENQDFYIGIDIHKKSWAVAIRHVSLLVDRFTQPASAELLANFVKRKYPGGNYYSAYEAGFSGMHVHRELCRLGIKNIVVNPSDIPSTERHKKRKTDEHDSFAIAQYLEKGLLSCIHIHSIKQQEIRSLSRCRLQKVRDVVCGINRLKMFLLYFGIQLPEEFQQTTYLSKRALEWLSKLKLTTEAGSICLKNNIGEVVYQRQKLVSITKQLRIQIQQRFTNEYESLLSVPGIGSITAMSLLSEIGDFNRFDDPSEYCSYLGLVPWDHSSGENIKTMGMQPRCNTYLRPLIIEASWAAIRNDTGLLAYYKKHVARSSKKAITKVARKLALIARAVVQKKQSYIPSNLQLREK